jgi:hypothetical protein
VLASIDNQRSSGNGDDIRDMREAPEPAPGVVSCRTRIQKNKRRKKGLLGYQRKASQRSIVNQLKRVGFAFSLLNIC